MVENHQDNDHDHEDQFVPARSVDSYEDIDTTDYEVLPERGEPQIIRHINRDDDVMVRFIKPHIRKNNNNDHPRYEQQEQEYDYYYY